MKLKEILSCLSILLLITSSAERVAARRTIQAQSQNTSLSKFDEFQNENCEVELAHLDNFAIEVQSNPDSLAYIIVYGGRVGRNNEAQAFAARMRFYLTRTRGLDGRRLFTIEGGFRENLTTELWLGRRGEAMPTPTPTVRSQDVKLKGRLRVRGYDCGANLGG